MIADQLAGMIIMCFCCFGCAFTFLFLGIHASKRNTPINFWAGSQINPESVSDVAAYNRENARMWKFYSLPYFLSGALALPASIHEGFTLASAAVLLLAAFPGIPLLIRHYQKIERKYINTKILDKTNPFC